MFRTPDHYGYINAIGYITKQLKASIFGTYTGSMLVQHNAGWIDHNRTEHTPSFWDFGARLAYRFQLTQAIALEVNGGVKNIFDSFQKDLDKGEFRDSGYFYGPTQPRTFFVGVNIMN